MIKKYNLLLLLVLFIILGTILSSIIIGISFYYILVLLISLILIYFLSKSKGLLGFSIAILIIIFNIFYIIFAMIPTYSKNVNIQNYFEKKKDYIEININDSKEKLKENSAILKIQNNKRGNKYKLYSKNIKEKNINIEKNDKITFVSKNKNLNTTIDIKLRDGSILNLLPQSTIKINKLYKDEKNLLNSKTEIELINGDMFFSVLRTIVDQKGFNIKTDQGIIVIRGTSGYVKHDKNTKVFSKDHIIEVINNAGKSIKIGKETGAIIKDKVMEKIDIESFLKDVGKSFYKKINRIYEKNMNQFKKYKKNLKSYVKENYSRIFDENSRMKTLSKLKMNIKSLYNKKARKNLENFYEYQSLLGKGNQNFDKIIKQNIIVPINKNYEKIKLKYFKQKGEKENYIIQKYNQIIDKGKEKINFDKIKKTINENDSIQRIKQKIEVLIN